MVPYKKYVVLYTLQCSSFLNFKIRLVEVGLQKEFPEIPIIDGTFAFRIISSQLPLQELAYDFANSEELKNSRIFYIGKKYSVRDYMRYNPEYDIDEDVMRNCGSFYIAETFPVGSSLTHPVLCSIFAHSKVISESSALAMLNGMTLDELKAKYEQIILH